MKTVCVVSLISCNFVHRFYFPSHWEGIKGRAYGNHPFCILGEASTLDFNVYSLVPNLTLPPGFLNKVVRMPSPQTFPKGRGSKQKDFPSLWEGIKGRAYEAHPLLILGEAPTLEFISQTVGPIPS